MQSNCNCLPEGSIPGRGTLADLEYCRYRQRIAADYRGPDELGALLGWFDWRMEEELIMRGAKSS